MAHEWAQTADDVLWRRSKLGLRVSRESGRGLSSFMTDASGNAAAGSASPIAKILA